jgi:hypothetical protein
MQVLGTKSRAFCCATHGHNYCRAFLPRGRRHRLVGLGATTRFLVVGRPSPREGLPGKTPAPPLGSFLLWVVSARRNIPFRHQLKRCPPRARQATARPQASPVLGPLFCGFAKSCVDVYLACMFEFCLPTRSTIVPHGPDWLHEIKYDGYRVRLERDGDRVRLITRGGYN